MNFYSSIIMPGALTQGMEFRPFYMAERWVAQGHR